MRMPRMIAALPLLRVFDVRSTIIGYVVVDPLPRLQIVPSHSQVTELEGSLLLRHQVGPAAPLDEDTLWVDTLNGPRVVRLCAQSSRKIEKTTDCEELFHFSVILSPPHLEAIAGGDRPSPSSGCYGLIRSVGSKRQLCGICGPFGHEKKSAPTKARADFCRLRNLSYFLGTSTVSTMV